MRTFIAAIVLTLFIATPVSAFKDTEEQVMTTSFSGLISFGDSFSDNGFADGHGFKRYCEAWTWVEYLAQMLGLPHDNWAWGGAMSNDRNCNHPKDVQWAGLSWQIDEYLKTLKKDEDISKTLFTVMCGSNDAWFDLTDGAATGQNIHQAMRKLANAGARHILYRETPTALMAPGYLEGEYAKLSEPWINLVKQSNQTTKRLLLDDLIKEFPAVKVYYLETDPLFTKIKNGEEGFKFKVLDKPWWGTYAMPEDFSYVWYDNWHPMSHVHKLMAQESLEFLRKDLK